MRKISGEIKRISSLDDSELATAAKELQAPLDLVRSVAKASEGLGEAMTSLETRKLEESQLLAGRGW